MSEMRSLEPHEEPQLDVNEIQGNILPGFMKPSLQLCALRIDDVAQAKQWIGENADRITNLAQTLETRKKVRALRSYQPLAKGTLGEIPEEVDDAWINVSFSCSGLTKLLNDGPHEGDLEHFEDPAFRVGLAARSSLLGDPTDPGAEGNPRNWVVGKPGEEVDVLLCAGADDPAKGELLMEELRGTPEATGMVPCYEQDGAKLDDLGAEQFGFQDGVSQPGVRGLTPEGEFLTPRTIAPSAIPESWMYGLPGQLLTWPGDYVFGYPASGADPRLPGPVTAVGPEAPAWTRNGSYLAFRRFRQDVPGLWAFLADQAEKLSRQPGFVGWDAERLAAHLVGRWKSGAPLPRSPEEDDLALGTNRLANNDFGFAAPSVQLPLAKGGETPPFPLAQGDPIGATCPMAAHIRKVNARTGGGDMGGRKASFQRRILRRGLPWGPKLEDPFKPDPGDDGQRGLLFLSYQASIARQFEFLCTSWMGTEANPRSPGGFDLWVGQNGEPGQNGRRHATLFGNKFETGEVVATESFVIPTGGGYFFTPSISALREVIAA